MHGDVPFLDLRPSKKKKNSTFNWWGSWVQFKFTTPSFLNVHHHPRIGANLKSVQWGVIKLKDTYSLNRKVMTNLDSILKSRNITLPTKVCLVKAMIFPVLMCGYESWTIKKAENQRIDAFELWCWRRLLRVPWNARRSNQSILKENQSWIFIGRTEAEAETPILWPPDGKNWLIGKDLDVGKDWRREEKGPTEDEMVGWHHWLNGHGFE